MKARRIRDGGSNALTEHEIQDIPLDDIYTWIRSGDWTRKDFRKWASAVRLDWTPERFKPSTMPSATKE